MTGNKWRVTGAHGDHPWISFDDNESGTTRCTRWAVEGPDGYSRGEFPTHAEALAEADRLARTVQITLPRPTSHAMFDAGNGYTTHFYQDMSGWIWLESDGRSFAITARELEPVALALLAHHHRKARP